MFKTLTLTYLTKGAVYNENRVYSFENENLGTLINIAVPEDYKAFTFVMDCKNGTVTKQIELGTGETSYSFSLDDSLTVTGTLELQLWATILNSQDETVKVQWEKYNLTIDDALNISTITAESNPDIIATHTAQIADLYNITSILDTTGDGTKYLSDDGTYNFVTETIDYNDLDDKPQINSVELIGNRSLSELGIQPAGSYEPANSNIQSHISDSNIHLTSTEKTNVGKLVSTGDGSKYLGDDGNYTTVSSGTMDYYELSNKPSINSISLSGDKTGAELRLGEELHYRVKASVSLSKGDLCESVGYGSGYMLVRKATWSGSNNYPQYFMGIATSNIASGDYGTTMYFGILEGINTNSWNAGDYLYLDQATSALSNSYPTAAGPIFVLGIVLEKAVSGVIQFRPQWIPELRNLGRVSASSPSDSQFLMYSSSQNRWINANKPSYAVSELTDYTILKTYCGFVNRTDSNLTINASGVVTLAPAVTSFVVYTSSAKHTITSTQTVTVTSDQTITYLYLDTVGALQKSASIWDLLDTTKAPVAIVFKDGTSYALTDERHSWERNHAWHNWAHFNIGAMYKSGLTGTFATSSLSVQQGIISDEDIAFDTGGTKTTCSLWYRNATTGMRLVRGATAAKSVSGGGILQYDNGSGTLQDVTNNRYSTNWVYASNDPIEPIYCVVGQGDYTNLNNARNALAPTINLSTAEWKLIYRVIYQRTTGTPAGEFVEAADFRTVQTGIPTSAITTDHAGLINRDATNSHPASAISYDNGSDTLTNVQSELDLRINKTYTLDILTSDWSANSFAQTVTGLLAADIVIVQAPDTYYIDYGLSYTQSSDTITFTVTTTPLVTLSLSIAVIKAAAGGAL